MAGTLQAWAIHLAMAAAAALISAALIVVLYPLLARYALARPTARSSHKQPTPQGGGIAVIAAMTLVTAARSCCFRACSTIRVRSPARSPPCSGSLWSASPTTCGRWRRCRGWCCRPPPSPSCSPRCRPKCACCPCLPWWLERALLLIGGVWFVNLTNFMDGIDWMTVAEVVPVTAALALFGALGALPPGATAVAFALCGAMLGFAPFNRPVAHLFLGDVGSLPIGLALAWLLILLAGHGHLSAALLLPLYYAADTTITLLRRLIKGEPIMQAHRSHYFQRAVDRGMGVSRIVTLVFALNIVLCVLAAIAVLTASSALHFVLLAIGVVCVAALLINFNGGYRPKT